MTYFAMVIVAEGDTPDDAWENLTTNGHLVDAATFVGDAWEIQPPDTPLSEFDTGDCIRQRTT